MLRLLVLEGDVGRQDVAVLQVGRHVRVAAAMVHDQATHQARVLVRPVQHVHALHHMQVNGGAVLTTHAQHGVRHDLRQLVSHLRRQLGAQGSAGSRDEELAVPPRLVADAAANACSGRVHICIASTSAGASTSTGASCWGSSGALGLEELLKEIYRMRLCQLETVGNDARVDALPTEGLRVNT